jgi:predicted thioesterase
MEFDIPLDLSQTRKTMVDEALTAKFIGSGIVDVLATPMMIALMEAAAMDAVQPRLPDGWTTVGTKIQIEHLRATPKGEEISATAVLVKKEGRKLIFSLQAFDRYGLIGQGSHERFVIHIKKFQEKIST